MPPNQFQPFSNDYFFKKKNSINFNFGFKFNSFQTTLPLLHPCTREYSSVHTQQPAKPVREVELDPYILLDDDIKYVTQDIRDVSMAHKRFKYKFNG